MTVVVYLGKTAGETTPFPSILPSVEDLRRVSTARPDVSTFAFGTEHLSSSQFTRRPKHVTFSPLPVSTRLEHDLDSKLPSTSDDDRRQEVMGVPVEPTPPIIQSMDKGRQDLVVALMRDKTLLHTESAAWSYVSAYDIAFQQYHHNGTVEPALQRTLVYGISRDYLTLERFSSDGRHRRDQVRHRRRAILAAFQTLQAQSPDDWDTKLGAYCAAINHASVQWALFLGHLQAAACKVNTTKQAPQTATNVVVNGSKSEKVPLVVPLQTKRSLWPVKAVRRKMRFATSRSIKLTA